MGDPIHSRIVDALERLATLARASAQQGAQSESLSPLQARALVALRRRGHLRVGELADALMVSYGTISAAASSLEEKGLVAKQPDPVEHRAVQVGLTRKGTHAARRAEGWAPPVFEPAVAELAPHEAAALLATLLKLIRSLERRGLIPTGRMCVSCRHFAPNEGRGARPHYCRLLNEAIGNEDLRVDCPEHEAASPDRLDELWRAFTAVD